MIKNDMEKRKVKVSRSYKERVKKILRAFQANDDGVILELEFPVSNEELASEIKKSVNHLNKLIKEAKKRGIKVYNRTGMLGLPVELPKLEIDIYETIHY